MNRKDAAGLKAGDLVKRKGHPRDENVRVVDHVSVEPSRVRIRFREGDWALSQQIDRISKDETP